MDLLERYLQAVRFLLPRRQQEDILRELGEDLREQMEDREAELERPLTEDEQAEVLRRSGHPAVVAGRYHTHRFLIGPRFFRMYVTTLKAGLAVAALVTVFVAFFGAALSDTPGTQLFRLLLAYPRRAFLVFGWTTLAFAVLDLFLPMLKLPRQWDPRSLPPVVRFEHQMSRSRTVFELLVWCAVLVWLLLLPGRPFLVMGSAARLLELTPIWSTLYLPFVLVATTAIALAGINVVRPYWTSARSIARIVYFAGALASVLVLLSADAWVAAQPGATLSTGASLDRVVHIINVTTQLGLIGAAFTFAGGLVWEILILRSRRKATASTSPAAAGAGR